MILRKLFPILTLLAILISSCSTLNAVIGTPAPAWDPSASPRPVSTQTLTTPPASTATAAEAWYSLYFTDPDNPGASRYRGGPDETLAAAIQSARLSVDVAIYDLNLWSIRNALLDAHRRGVTVRMVTDSDNLEREEIQALKGAGIPVLGDRREGYMHNKFVVIDRQEVWSGSMNFTTSDAYRNQNNLIRIRSQQLAKDYTTEFEEMFTDDHFGSDTVANTPYPKVTVDDTPIEVYFSPDDGTAQRLVELVQGAQKSIFFLAFSFTSDDLARAMIKRAREGVKVAGVMDESQSKSNMGTEYSKFRSNNLDVRLDGGPGNLHDKVLIIDGEIAVTGSYNFSANAENTNDENTLVIHNADIAAQYTADFDKIFEKGKTK